MQPKHANLATIVGDWIGALRARDAKSAAALLAPDVRWDAVDGLGSCADRDQVEIMLEDRVSRQEFLIDGLEFAAADEHVVMGARGPDFDDLEGLQLAGQVFNVFSFRDGVIVEIRDFRTRAEALQAAGIQPAAATWR